MPQVPLDVYLDVLRNSDRPLDPSMGSPAVNAAFAHLTRAVASFVDACRADESWGYAKAREVMEELTHTFPLPPREGENGAITPLGGGMTAVDLSKATDAQIRQIAEMSGMPFELLKKMQAARLAAEAAKGTAPAPADNTPSSGVGVTDWRALEAQFNDDAEGEE